MLSDQESERGEEELSGVESMSSKGDTTGELVEALRLMAQQEADRRREDEERRKEEKGKNSKRNRCQRRSNRRRILCWR